MRFRSSVGLRLAIGVVLGVVGIMPVKLALAAAEGSQAQSSDTSLEDIVVTGTKREVASQSVPIAVSAISEADLQNSHVNDIRGLAELAPGLVLSQPSGFNAAGGGMRGTGVGVILVTQDAPVGFLMDDFVLSQVTSQFVNMFDTQQVEVYRGPQGTLFGASTTGGVISLTSRKPEFNKYYDETEMTYGEYENGAPLDSVKTAINVPIYDKLAFRLAILYDYDAGYYTNSKNTATFPNDVPLWSAYGIPVGTPVSPTINTTTVGNGERLGGRDVIAAKAKLLWEPTDNYSAYFITELVRDRSGAVPGVNESGPTDLLTLLGFPGIELAHQTNPYATGQTDNQVIEMGAGHRVDVQGLYLTQALNTSFGEFKSITGYRQEQQRFPSTYTGEAFDNLFDSSRNTDRFNFQQEFRFASKFSGPFNFVAGANYNHDSFDMLSYYAVGLTSLVPVFDAATNSYVNSSGYVNLNTEALNDYEFQGTRQTRHQEGLFWDGNYQITDKLTFTGGVRYSADHKNFLRYVNGGGPCTALTQTQDIEAGTSTCLDSHSNFISRAGISPSSFDEGVFSPLPLSAYGTVVNTSASWNKTTYRGVFDYKFDQSKMVFLSYATGFLAGGYSETCATVSRCRYNPETNTNTELGFKSDWLDGTLRFNISAYLTKYNQLQRAAVAAYIASDGTSQQETVTINTGSSKAEGIDLESAWVPTHEWKFTGSMNYLHHRYISGQIPDLLDIPPGPATDLTKYKVPYSPEWKLGLGANYNLNLASGAYWTFHVDGDYQSEAETDVYNTIYTQMTARTLLNAMATFHNHDGKWTVSPWVSNVTDKIYRTAGEHVAGLWTFTNYGAPRSFGLTANFKFE